MTREQIIKEVLARMDELSPLDGINTIPNPVVEKLLDESARNILLTAPLQFVPVTHFVSALQETITSPEVSVKQIKLPDGFLRLVAFQLDKWIRPTRKVAQQGSILHNRQYNKYAFGGVSRPVVTVVNGVNGLSLEYYFKKGTAPTVTKADCVVSTTAQNIPDILLVPLFWYCAGMAFDVFEKFDTAKMAYERVKEHYQFLVNA